jgi:tetratricopeptide (TPR) repeat protein
MSRSRRRPRNRGTGAEGTLKSPADKARKQEEQPPSPRSFLKDLLFGLVVCVVFFSLLEIGLRIAGVPRIDPEQDPFVGFSSLRPLFDVNDGIASVAPAKLRFFNAASFSAKKPADTFRVFGFGESTTYGHPFDGRTSFCRWLQDLLKASCPDRKVEVINTGGISYASYRILPIVRETLAYEPDLMIILLGHNEFLERRTYAGLFDQGRTLVEAKSWLERWNTYRMLERLLGLLQAGRAKKPQSAATGQPDAETANPSADGSAKHPAKAILGEEVTAILDRSAGLELYHRDEDFSREVIRHFQYNFRSMLSLCKQAGVPVIVVEPASNLKDFSPFKSEHASDLSASEKGRLEDLLRRSEQLVDRGEYGQAVGLIDQAILQDPLYADYYFWKGRALLGLGRCAEARENFVKAKDLDVCPLRSLSGIDEQIRSIARDEKVMLVPFRDVVDRHAAPHAREMRAAVSRSETDSPGRDERGSEKEHVYSEPAEPSSCGIPGDESFLDHVHPTVALHQELAALLLDQIVDSGLFRRCHPLTRDEREKLLADGMAGMDKQFFLLRDLNLAKTLRWAGRKREAREALNRVATDLDSNAEVHKMLGSFLLEDGNYSEAVKEYRRAVALSGSDSQMVFALAIACHRAGLEQDALEEYRRLVEQDKTIPEAFANLATLRLEHGQVADAMEVLKAGLKQHPDSASLFAPYALTLALSGHLRDAIPWQQRAVEAEPGNAKHLYNLAGMQALAGDVVQALRSLDLAVQRGYSDVRKIDSDPVFATLRGQAEYERILRRLR